MSVLRVLVVEDDALIGELLSEILAEMGFQVMALVATEADAVALALRERPDLMIVDAELREGSGVAALAAILRTGHVPYVLMSGQPIADGPSGAIELQKPFVEPALAHAIRRALAAAPSCAACG